MKITDEELRQAKKAKTKRAWVKTQWKEVEDEAFENGLCYSTWYHRVRAGECPKFAATYPPCPVKGRRDRK